MEKLKFFQIVKRVEQGEVVMLCDESVSPIVDMEVVAHSMHLGQGVLYLGYHDTRSVHSVVHVDITKLIDVYI